MNSQPEQKRLEYGIKCKITKALLHMEKPVLMIQMWNACLDIVNMAGYSRIDMDLERHLRLSWHLKQNLKQKTIVHIR